jgi:uncharacterized membrane protein HdeD (DUF308 family)
LALERTNGMISLLRKSWRLVLIAGLVVVNLSLVANLAPAAEMATAATVEGVRTNCGNCWH